MDVLDLKAIISLDTSKYDSGLDKAKGKLSSFGSVVSTAGGAFAKGIGTAIKTTVAAIGAATGAVASFASSSVKTGQEFDKSMSQVYATMGEKAQESIEINGRQMKASEALRDFALEMGKTTQFTASQASEALNYMALAGYDVETSMSMLPNVLNLAAAGNMELGRASDMVTDAQTALGLSINETTRMVDQMAVTASNTNTSVEQLGDAMLTIGGTAQYMKGGTAELSQVLGLLADNGIKGSEAGTHLRNMLLKLSAPTKEGEKILSQFANTLGHELVFDEKTGEMRAFKDIFTDLNEVMADFTDEQKITTFSELFNARDVASANALLGTTVERWEDVQDAISRADEAGVVFHGQLYSMSEAQAKFGDAMKQIPEEFEILTASERMAREQMDNLAGDTEYFKSALENVKIMVSDALTPSIREFVQFGTEGLQELADAFKEGGFEGLVEKFTSLFSRLVSIVTEKIPEFISAGAQILSAVATGIMQNIGLIVSTGVDLIVQFITGFIHALPEVVKAAGEIISEVKKAFSSHSEELLSAGKELIDFLWNGVISNASKVTQGALDIITWLIQGLTENLPAITTGAVQLVQELVNGISASLPALIPAAVEAILTFVKGLLDNSGSLVDSAITLISALVDGLLNALPLLIEMAPEIIVSLIKGSVEALPKLVDLAAEIITKLVVSLIENFPELVGAAIEMIMAFVGGAIGMLTEVRSIGTQIMDKVKEGIASIDPIQWGKDLITNFVEGIKSGWDALTDVAGGLADRIAAFLHFSVPDEGPLADADTYMPDFMKLLSEGISSNGGDVEKALLDVLNNLVTALTTSGQQMVEKVIATAQQIVTDVTTNLTTLDSLIRQKGEEFLAYVVQTLTTLLNRFIEFLSQLPPKMLYYAQQAVNNFMRILNELPGKVQQVLTNILNKVAAFASELISKAAAAAQGFANSLINGIRDLPSRFYEIGTNIVQGIWNGISSGWDWLTSQVADLANSLLEAAKDALDIESPSKKFMWVGRMVDEGFAKGIDDYKYLVENQFDDLSEMADIDTTSSAQRAAAGYTQVVNITSPTALSPYEVARQTRNATRDMVLALSGV